MLLMLLGSAGLGLVWGWLLGSRAGRVRRLAVTLLAAGLGSALLALPVWLLASGSALLVFAGSVALATLVHLAWRHELYMRYRSSTK